MSVDPIQVLPRIDTLSLGTTSSSGKPSVRLPKPVPQGRCARTGCKNEATPGFKSCEPCRVKGREDQRKYNARKEEKRRQVLLSEILAGRGGGASTFAAGAASDGVSITSDAGKRKSDEPEPGPSKKLKEDSISAKSSTAKSRKRLKKSSGFVIVNLGANGTSVSSSLPAGASSPATSSPPPADGSLTPMDGRSSPSAPQQGRRCTKCKRVVLPEHHRYKYCDPCRHKNTEESRKYQQRKREKEMEIYRAQMGEDPLILSADPQNISLKVQKVLYITQPKIYQTGGALYAALSRCAKRVKPGRHLRFAGTFALVAHEAERLDTRAITVMSDIKRLSGVLTGSTVTHTTTASKVCLRRACVCGRNAPNQDDGCGGTIEVTCELDLTHKFLPGVSVVVRVEQPSP